MHNQISGVVYTCFPVRRELKRNTDHETDKGTPLRLHVLSRSEGIETCVNRLIIVCRDYGLHVLSRSEGIETNVVRAVRRWFPDVYRSTRAFPFERELKQDVGTTTINGHKQVYTCFPVRRELKSDHRILRVRVLLVYTCFPVRRELKPVMRKQNLMRGLRLHVLSRSEGIETFQEGLFLRRQKIQSTRAFPFGGN